MTEKPGNIEQRKYEINEITPDNQDLLVEIRQQTDNKKTAEQLSDEAERYANNEGFKAFITREGDVVTGYVEVILDDTELPKGAPGIENISELAHLARVGVSEDHQNKGLGKELLKTAEEYAESQGKKGMWLDYLPTPKLIAFYLSSGYKDLSEFKDGDKDRLRRITVKYFSI